MLIHCKVLLHITLSSSPHTVIVHLRNCQLVLFLFCRKHVKKCPPRCNVEMGRYKQAVDLENGAFKTRMHSSRMYTVRCSGRRGGCIPACTGWGCVYPSMHWAGVCPGGCPPQCMLGYTPLVGRILDTCL